MRGAFRNQAGLFSYLSLEERVPERHPLRNIRELVRAVLVDMTKDFAGRCHIVERRTREFCVPNIFKRPRLPRATCS